MRYLDDGRLLYEDASQRQHREQLIDGRDTFPTPKVRRCHGFFKIVCSHGYHERSHAYLHFPHRQRSEKDARLGHRMNNAKTNATMQLEKTRANAAAGEIIVMNTMHHGKGNCSRIVCMSTNMHKENDNHTQYHMNKSHEQSNRQ